MAVNPARAAMLLAALAGVTASVSVFGGDPAHRRSDPDPLPTADDLSRIESAARRRAARNAKRARAGVRR